MDNFCFHPWIGLDIDTQNGYKPCCKFLTTIANDLDSYQNSNQLKELKQSFLDDKKHPSCKRCWDDEAAGIESKRIIDKKYFIKDKNINLETDKIMFLSMCFGNTCNLACRSCSSKASSKWAQELKRHGNYRNQNIYKHNKFYKNTEFLEKLTNLVTEDAYVEIPGGEPLLSSIKEHLYFLSLLESKAENISLRYITNCTTFPSQDIIDIWSKFKQVDIQLSIDGIGNRFEFLRWPAKWDTVEHNIFLYKELSKTKNIKLSISHTISIYNILYLKEFIFWCKKNSLPTPYFGLVSNPKELDIRSLPKNIKEHIKNKVPKKIYEYMMQEDTSKYFDNFLANGDFLDKARKQDFSSYFPELYDLIKKAQ